MARGGYDPVLFQTPIYWIWSSMKSRCTNRKSKRDYMRYGARGISFTEKWDSFANFYSDMKDGYSAELTLDRINNDIGYCKENCRWVDRKVQANNRRSNKLLSFDGKTQTLAQWSDEIGIKRSTLQARLGPYKWSVNKALTTKVGEYFG